jgi:restriction endonuclease S subunit
VKALGGWKKCKVRDICELGRGRVISGQEIERNPGVFPVFSSQSSNNGKMGSIDTFDFDGEYVTWTTDGAYAGTVFYRSGQFNCTNVCGTLRAKDPQVCMSFLAYKLSTLAKDYVSYVGNPKLMNGVMAGIEFSIPTSKPEQTKIAEILSTVDQAIEREFQFRVGPRQLVENKRQQAKIRLDFGLKRPFLMLK